MRETETAPVGEGTEEGRAQRRSENPKQVCTDNAHALTAQSPNVGPKLRKGKMT